jgi:endonuclease G
MRKSRIAKRIFRRRTWAVACVLLLLYFAVAIGYYFIPWSVRKPIYKCVPTVDRMLRRNGFHLMQSWDTLALFGDDAEVVVDGAGRGDRFYAGQPVRQKQSRKHIKILENIGYTVGYSESMKNPLWVAYRVFDVQHLGHGPRESRFLVDLRTKAKVKHDDYTNSGFDRGHMAPNYSIATRYGATAQKETFLMSNIIPQTPRVNQRVWESLEHKVATQYGRYFSEVWVITGPVFKKPVKRLDSGVSIPSHYYKIIADENNGKLRVMAFLVSRSCPPYTRIKTYLVSVDCIEELTGLDFFPDMPVAEQEVLEAGTASRLWPTVIPAFQYFILGKTE